MESPVTPVPWAVAEAVAVKVATLQPRSVAVVPEDPRLCRAVQDASVELGLGAKLTDIAEGPPVDLLVFQAAPARPTAGARIDLLHDVGRSIGDVVLCERLVDGCGLGGGVLAHIDPSLRRLEIDEVDDAVEGTRARKPWEPPTYWVVAEAAAWRFLTDAELARSGFVRRLPRLSAAQMVMTARRILSRFDTAHELLLLSLRELSARGDLEGMEAVMREIRLHPEAAPSIRRRAADMLAAVFCERPTRQMPVAV